MMGIVFQGNKTLQIQDCLEVRAPSRQEPLGGDGRTCGRVVIVRSIIAYHLALRSLQTPELAAHLRNVSSTTDTIYLQNLWTGERPES